MKRTGEKIGCLLLSLALLLTLLPVSVLAVETDTAKIMADAFALTSGEWLPYEATLTGKVIKVDQVYSAQYKNITVTIEVPGYPDKPIKCYRMVGTGTDEVDIGYTITVSGYITNYNGTVEFTKKDDVKCQLVEIVDRGIQAPKDPKQIVDDAYALDYEESLPYKSILTGLVISIDTPYDTTYKNLTATIVVEGRENRPIKCYRMKGDLAKTLAVGDLITVTGNIGNFSIWSGEYYIGFSSGCTFVTDIPGDDNTDVTTVYCHTHDSWEECYVYWWGSTEATAWPGVLMTKGADGVWEGTVPSDAMGMLFAAGDGNPQTGDLTVPTDDKVKYVVANNEWIPRDAEVVIVERYFVAGDGELCGSAWDVNDANNIMTEGENGVWTKIYQDVPAGEYQLKVTDGTWNNTWYDDQAGTDGGYENYVLKLEATADVKVVFDSVNEIVTVEIDYCNTDMPIVTLPKDNDDSVITLFVKVPTGWTTVNAYAWSDTVNNILATWPGKNMTEKDGDWYKIVIPTPATGLVINNGFNQTDDLTIQPGKDVYVTVTDEKSASKNMATVQYADDSTASNFCVVGNADWMGNWDPTSDAGRMQEVSPGIYKRTFENVQPGNYELKIIRDGMWEHSWGDNGINFCFTIGKTCDITVTFTLSGGNGTISVKGSGIGVPSDLPDDPAEILEQAYALEEGESMPYDVTLTGRISAINTPYDEQFRNITVTIKVPGHNDKPIVCYRLKGEGADRLDIGMTITVSGRLCNYYGSIEFNAGCTLVSDDCKHNYKLTVIPASCTKGSYEAQVCTLCGDMDPDSISPEISVPLGHQYETTVVSPTCTLEGYAVHTCSVCGTGYTGGKTPALGHRFSGFVADGNATCFGDGTKTATCRLCGLTETVADEGSALGHSFTHYRYDYNALCQQDGTETAKCDRCAKTDTRTRPGSALGHQYTGGYCERCGKEEAQRLPGDMTGDNNLNIIDVAKLYALIRSSDLVVDEELLAYADLTGDGKLNVIDVAKLYAQIKTSGR